MTGNDCGGNGDAPRGHRGAGVERRRHARHRIALPGYLEASATGQRACWVRDYCAGGLLLQLQDTAAPGQALGVGDRLRLYVDLLDASGPRPMVIEGQLAWIRAEHLGVSFGMPSPDVLRGLEAHNRVSAKRPAPPGTALAGDPPVLSRLREIAQEIACQRLPGLLQRLLRDTEEKLLDAADGAVSDLERQAIFHDLNALNVLVGDDRQLGSICEAALEKCAGGASEASSAEEWSLVDPEQFECWLEASRVATQLEQRFSLDLSRIGSRLAALRRGAAPGAVEVPFEPQQFTEGLIEVVQRLELAGPTRRALFDQAAGTIAPELARLYRALDETLAPVAAPEVEDGRAQGLAPARRSRAERPAELDGAADKPARADVGPPSEVRATASTRRAAAQRASFARDLLGRIGAAQVQDGAASEWLRQLEAPLVREAQANHRFFDDPEHPLRAILDGLAHLEHFRGGGAEGADDQLSRRVVDLIAPVGNRQASASDLHEVAAAVGQLVAETSAVYQRRVERVVEASEWRDRARRARAAVARELHRRYAGAPVPEVLLELLDAGWRAALERSWLRPAGEAEAYQAKLALADQLVRTLGQRTQGGESASEQAVLFAGLSAELDAAVFDPYRRTAVEARLRRELLEPAATPAKLTVMPALEDGRDEPAVAQAPEGVSAQAWQAALTRAEGIRVGDRLRLLDDPGGQRDLRFAWIRDDRALFALVDHRGVKARDIALRELALALARQRAEVSPVDGRPASDGAVDTMLEHLGEPLTGHAEHAALTGLSNRRQFHANLEAVLAKRDGSAGGGVLALLDIDHFRLVNDVHGYDTGDRLLIALAGFLQRVGEADLVGHLGGGRFAVLRPGVDIEAGRPWADQLCRGTHTLPFVWPGQALNLSLSVGVVSCAEFEPDAGVLLQAAESALRAAKSAGGDRTYLYRREDPAIAKQAESVQWVMQVDRALDAGELRLRCQQIAPVCAGEGLRPHYEVLLGVRSESGGILPAAEFIDAAERYHRMRAVDRWVVRTVFEWIAAHRDSMAQLHAFAINLSGQTASDPEFIGFVREQLRSAELDPSWVSFEVTETAAIADLGRSAGIIRDLKALGCKVALDDFGSGLASYSYLRALPVDWLKIDGVFVRDIAHDENDYAVVRSINEIGHFLGKQTIAEYVTDGDVLRLVGEIGVDYVQGYGVAPPMLMDELLEQPASVPR